MKFFHRVINRRRRQNSILSLTTEDSTIEDPIKIKNELFKHFEKLLDHDQAQAPFSLQEELLNKLQESRKQNLASIFTESETESALK